MPGVKGDIVLRDYSPPSVDRNGITRDTIVLRVELVAYTLLCNLDYNPGGL